MPCLFEAPRAAALPTRERSAPSALPQTAPFRICSSNEALRDGCQIYPRSDTSGQIIRALAGNRLSSKQGQWRSTFRFSACGPVAIAAGARSIGTIGAFRLERLGQRERHRFGDSPYHFLELERWLSLKLLQVGPAVGTRSIEEVDLRIWKERCNPAHHGMAKRSATRLVRLVYRYSQPRWRRF